MKIPVPRMISTIGIPQRILSLMNVTIAVSVSKIFMILLSFPFLSLIKPVSAFEAVRLLRTCRALYFQNKKSRSPWTPTPKKQSRGGKLLRHASDRMTVARCCSPSFCLRDCRPYPGRSCPFGTRLSDFSGVLSKHSRGGSHQPLLRSSRSLFYFDAVNYSTFIGFCQSFF